MHYQIVEGIQHVERALWAQIIEGHPFAGWEWCRYADHALGAGYYVLVYAGDQPVAGAMFSLRYQEHIPTQNHLVHWSMEQFLARRPLLVCRTPLSTMYRGIYLPSDSNLRDEALTLIREAAAAIAAEKRASFVVYDYLEETNLGWGWGDAVRLSAFMDEGTRLDIVWETYDEYMASLKRKRRKSILRNTRAAIKREITVRFNDHLTHRDKSLALIHAVSDKYQMARNPFAQTILDNLSDIPHFVWMTAHCEGQLVGCELMLYDAANRVCNPILFGKDQNTEDVYFYMYYEEIRYAIETLKAATLIGNSEQYDFKYRLGFVPDLRNNMVFSAASGIWHGVARGLIKLAGW